MISLKDNFYDKAHGLVGIFRDRKSKCSRTVSARCGRSRLYLGCVSAVSRLYLAHLLEVVFATETLAAGINMPARTTVVTTLSKRGDRGVEPLAASALLQLAGRSTSRRASPVLADE